MSDRHYDSRLYNRRYHLFEDVVETIQRFETLLVLERSPCERFNLYIKLKDYSIAHRRWKQLIKTLNVIIMGYKKRLSLGKEDIGRSLGRNLEP